jgi:2-iminoacetate synthase ThiH
MNLKQLMEEKYLLVKFKQKKKKTIFIRRINYDYTTECVGHCMQQNVNVIL